MDNNTKTSISFVLPSFSIFLLSFILILFINLTEVIIAIEKPINIGINA